MVLSKGWAHLGAIPVAHARTCLLIRPSVWSLNRLQNLAWLFDTPVSAMFGQCLFCLATLFGKPCAKKMFRRPRRPSANWARQNLYTHQGTSHLPQQLSLLPWDFRRALLLLVSLALCCRGGERHAGDKARQGRIGDAAYLGTKD